MTMQMIEKAQFAVRVLYVLTDRPPASDYRVQCLLDKGPIAVQTSYEKAMFLTMEEQG